MTMHVRDGFRIETRAEGDEDPPLRFVIATEGRKADGIDLRMDALDLDRYRSNPVILPSHNYRADPIGRGDNVEVDGGKLLADAVFDLDDPDGAQKERKYRGGFLNAVSVGFDVHGLDEDTGIPERWELLEFSTVSVPLDADAVLESERIARAFAITEELREGKVLSGKNKKTIQQALEALQSLLDAASDETKGHQPGDGRVDDCAGEHDIYCIADPACRRHVAAAQASIDLRRRRLQLA